jgi:hypothetical protein
MTDHDPATTAALAIMRQALRQACNRAPDPRGDPMQRENALTLPAPRQPWRTRRSYMLRSSALTLGSLRAPEARGNPMQRGKARPGPLRNGNPRGNPNAAPRCGACTRAGSPCRAPAMPNGRCRMHGGKSTGPRTFAGLERLRAATTKHGIYATSAARRARDPADPFALHAARTAIEDMHRLLALIRQAAPHDPDPAALRALLAPRPLPRPGRPHAT